MATNKHPLSFFWISALLTLLIGVWVMAHGGVVDLWLFVILVLLEVTFSFDNAVINSKVLVRMSRFWQTLFLTVGIIFAVFIVRFVLPIFIVMVSSGNGFSDVLNMALHEPVEYAHTMHDAAPLIEAFGGTFLIMIGVNYFMDRDKDIHWLKRTEKWLTKFGSYETFKVLIMLSIAMILYATVDKDYRVAVLLSSIIAVMLHIGLDLFGRYFSSKQTSTAVLVGTAAFASFVYLNVLDASFSLDGVIGAFVITNDVLLIMAGLGAGALWVRSLTVYLTRTGTLAKYRYLEHGAHWAILVLGVVMLAKLYHFEPPEWFTGSLGLIFIFTAIITSIIEKKRDDSKNTLT